MAKWLSCSPMSGGNDGTLAITIERNEGNTSRIARIRVQNTETGLFDYINIRQSAGQYREVEVPKEPSSRPVEPEKKTLSWTATTDSDWITLTKASGESGENVQFDTTENGTGAERTGFITITYSDGTTEVIKVIQKGTSDYYFRWTKMVYYVDEETAQEVEITEIPANGSLDERVLYGQFDLRFESNIPQINVSDFSYSTGMRVYGASTKGNGSVSFNVNPNTSTQVRNHYITYNSEYLSEPVTINFIQESAGQPVTENTKLYYTTTDGNTLYLYERKDEWHISTTAYDAAGNIVPLLNNTYVNGQGVIEFDGVVDEIRMDYLFKWDAPCTLKSFDGASNKVKFFFPGSPYYGIFYGQTNLERVSFRNIDLSSTRMAYAFWKCINLVSIDWGTQPERQYGEENGDWNCAFMGCSSIGELDLTPLGEVRPTSMDLTFAYCANLRSVDISNFATSALYDEANNESRTTMCFYGSPFNILRIGPHTVYRGDRANEMFDYVPAGGTLYYPNGLDSNSIEKWTPSGWTAVAY